MNPSLTRRHPSQIRPIDRPWADRKEIRRMSRTFARVLDASVSVAVVCLALYLGAATTILGVV